MIIAWCLDMVVMMVLGWREILLGGRFISWLSIQMMRMMDIMWRGQVFFAGRFIARLDLVMMVMIFVRRWEILLAGWLISWFAVMVRWWWG